MNWIQDLNIELFHFLRPQYLWLFLPMLLVIIISLFGGKNKHQWKNSIDPKLLPYLLIKGNRLAIIAPIISFTLAISLMIIAASGPTWKKIDVPGAKSEAILLIALDLSPSMLVDDVSPNRLERAKFKIHDLLDANPGSKVGLIAFAGSCHPVVTPCTDYQLLNYQLKSLNPYIMPLQGTNYTALLNIADTILNRTEAPSTLLLVTDNIDNEQANQLIAFADKGKNKIEIITMATTQGARIPGLTKGSYFKENGQFIISKLDQHNLFKLQKHNKINVNPLSLEKDDVNQIAATVRKNLSYQKNEEESEESWKEMGFSLLWLALIFIILWFRKGWMVQWCFIVCFLSACNQNINTWNDLWYTNNYQAQTAMNQENFDQAAEKFESLQHKGVAYYKAGDYEAAIQVFMQDSNINSLYNLGLAYAANGDNTLAEEALLLAQNMDPNNEKIAQVLSKNKQQITLKDSLAQVNQTPPLALPEKKKDNGKLEERKAKNKDEELSADNEVKELPKDGKRVTDEEETGISKGKEMDSPPENFQAEKTENASNVLLREISADPSEFLKRRFQYQHKKYYPNQKQPEKLW